MERSLHVSVSCGSQTSAQRPEEPTSNPLSKATSLHFDIQMCWVFLGVFFPALRREQRALLVVLAAVQHRVRVGRFTPALLFAKKNAFVGRFVFLIFLKYSGVLLKISD